MERSRVLLQKNVTFYVLLRSLQKNVVFFAFFSVLCKERNVILGLISRQKLEKTTERNKRKRTQCPTLPKCLGYKL